MIEFEGVDLFKIREFTSPNADIGEHTGAMRSAKKNNHSTLKFGPKKLMVAKDKPLREAVEVTHKPRLLSVDHRQLRIGGTFSKWGTSPKK